MALGQKIAIPADAKVYDLQGKTIMPGLVDAHAHIGAFRYGLTTSAKLAIYGQSGIWGDYFSRSFRKYRDRFYAIGNAKERRS